MFVIYIEMSFVKDHSKIIMARICGKCWNQCCRTETIIFGSESYRHLAGHYRSGSFFVGHYGSGFGSDFKFHFGSRSFIFVKKNRAFYIEHGVFVTAVIFQEACSPMIISDPDSARSLLIPILPVRSFWIQILIGKKFRIRTRHTNRNHLLVKRSGRAPGGSGRGRLAP